MPVHYELAPKRKRFIGSEISVTLKLILINIVFFIVAFLFLIFNESFINYIALKPSNILQGKYLWTLIIHFFMHGGIFHLLINMFVLFNLGMFMEKILGKKRFLWFYLISGIFAGLLSVFLSGYFGVSDLGARIFGSPEIFAVGASGAIFAIAGLFVVLLPKIRFAIIFFPFFSLPGYIMIPLVLVLTWIASFAGGWPIGNSAHFGGLVVGLIYGWYLRKKFPKKTQWLSREFS